MPDTHAPAPRTLAGFTQRVVLVAGIAVLALLLWTWRDVVLLAFAAALIAVALHGLADPIAKRTPLSGAAALALTGVSMLALLAALAWLFGAQIGVQMSTIVDQMPAALTRLRDSLMGTEAGAVLVLEAEAWARTAGGDGALGGALTRVGGYTLSLASTLIETLLVLFAAVFLAASPRAYVDGALMLFPRRARGDIEDALRASARALRKWLLGTIVSMLAMVALVGAGLWILGVPAFIALALIAGVAQFVPVVGPLLAAIPGVLLALTVGPETALWTALVYFIASQLEANLIYPLIQQRAVSMPSALTLFAVIAMGILFGPLGVLLATPLMVVAAVFVVKFYVRGVLGEDQPLPGA